jgi:hypothetical protein
MIVALSWLGACEGPRRSPGDGTYDGCDGEDGDSDGVVDEGGERSCGGGGFRAAACVDGACVVASCEEHRGDCNERFVDGCEASIAIPPQCGACGVRCEPYEACVAGECVRVGAPIELSGDLDVRLAPRLDAGVVIAGRFRGDVVLGGRELSTGGPLGSSTFVASFGGDGEVAFVHVSEPQRSVMNVDAITADDEAIYLAGHAVGGVALGGVSVVWNTPAISGFVGRIDHAGEVRWLAKLAVPEELGPFEESAADALVPVAGGVVVAGSLWRSEAGDAFQPMLTRLDANGSLEWSVSVRAVDATVAGLASGSALWVGGAFRGALRHGPSVNDAGIDGTDGFLTGWSNAGEELDAQWSVGAEYDNEGVDSVGVLSDGSPVVATHGPDGHSIVALTSAGVPRWEVPLASVSVRRLLAFDGSLWLVGRTFADDAMVGATSVTSFETFADLVVARLTEDGEVTKAIRFPTTHDETIHDAVFDPTGRLWIAFDSTDRSLVPLEGDSAAIVALDPSVLR